MQNPLEDLLKKSWKIIMVESAMEFQKKYLEELSE